MAYTFDSKVVLDAPGIINFFKSKSLFYYGFFNSERQDGSRLRRLQPSGFDVADPEPTCPQRAERIWGEKRAELGEALGLPLVEPLFGGDPDFF